MSIFGLTKDIEDKLSKKITSLSSKQVHFLQFILKRLKLKCSIDLLSQIKTITRVGFAEDDGFDFTSDKAGSLRIALMDHKSFIDDSKSLIGNIASSQTDGLSFREKGGSEDKSLHFAIGSYKCSVHLDKTLFTPFGGYYNADCFQHIGYDLGWRYHVVRRFIDVPYLGWALDHVHPILPHSSNRYKGDLGLSFKHTKWNINFGAYAKTSVKLKRPGLHHDLVIDPRNVMGFSGYEFGANLGANF